METHAWLGVTIDGAPVGTLDEGDTIERVRVGNDAAENGYQQDPAPVDWLNSAAIVVDAEEDSVTLTLSVDDPRGGFGLTVRRLSDGTLVMHVPYPESGWLHAPLVELHAGTYRIGSEGAYASTPNTDSDEYREAVDEYLTDHGLGDPALGLVEPSWGDMADAESYADAKLRGDR